MLTLQEIYDLAAAKLLSQKERCYDDEVGGCVYADGDNRCAVGHLLTEEELRLVMSENLNEQTSVDEVIKTLKIDRLGYCDETETIVDYHSFFLSDLQGVHDNGLHWYSEGLNEKGRDAIRRLADKYGLQSAV